MSDAPTTPQDADETPGAAESHDPGAPVEGQAALADGATPDGGAGAEAAAGKDPDAQADPNAKGDPKAKKGSGLKTAAMVGGAAVVAGAVVVGVAASAKAGTSGGGGGDAESAGGAAAGGAGAGGTGSGGPSAAAASKDDVAVGSGLRKEDERAAGPDDAMADAFGDPAGDDFDFDGGSSAGGAGAGAGAGGGGLGGDDGGDAPGGFDFGDDAGGEEGFGDDLGLAPEGAGEEPPPADDKGGAGGAGADGGDLSSLADSAAGASGGVEEAAAGGLSGAAIAGIVGGVAAVGGGGAAIAVAASSSDKKRGGSSDTGASTASGSDTGSGAGADAGAGAGAGDGAKSDAAKDDTKTDGAASGAAGDAGKDATDACPPADPEQAKKVAAAEQRSAAADQKLAAADQRCAEADKKVAAADARAAAADKKVADAEAELAAAKTPEERAAAQAKVDAAKAEQKAAQAEKKAADAEKKAAQAEKDAAQAEKEAAEADKRAAQATTEEERKQAEADKAAAEERKAAAKREQAAAEAERDQAKAAQTAAEREQREAQAKQYEAEKAAGKGDAAATDAPPTEEERRAAEDARREEEDAQRRAEDSRRKREDDRRAREDARRAQEDANPPKSEARQKAIEDRRKREDERRAQEDARRKEEDERRKQEDERRKQEDERRAREDAKQSDRDAREEQAKAADQKVPGLKRPQVAAIAEAIENATGLPMGKVLGVLQESIVNGKLDPQQLLGALQSLVKPLNVNALLGALEKAAERLGPLAGPLQQLIAGLRNALGLNPKPPAELPAKVLKKIQELAKQLENAKKQKKLDQKRGKAVCKIYKNGKPVPIDQDTIVSCVVKQSVDMVSSFRLVLTDNSLELSADTRFKEGESLEIKLGWEDGVVDTVIIGEITGRELDFPRRGPVVLVLNGLSFEHRLNRGRFSRMWQKTPDKFETSDKWILEQILGEIGPVVEQGTIEDPGVKYEWVLQNNLTNYEFLRQRAALYNFELFVDSENKLHFRKPAVKTKPTKKLTRGVDLKHFRARMNLSRQIAAVHVRGHNPKDPVKAIVGEAKDTDVIDKMETVKLGAEALKTFISDTMDKAAGLDQKKHGACHINVRTPVSDQKSAEELAKAIMNYYAFGFVTGDGSTFGDPELTVGKTVELDAIGKRFEGKYYVTTAAHIFEGGGYTTMFELARPGITRTDKGRQDQPDPPAPPEEPEVKPTYFELVVQGLKSLPFENHGLAVQRTAGKKPDEKPEQGKLDGSGKIRKDEVDPGQYAVILEEIMDDETDWVMG